MFKPILEEETSKYKEELEQLKEASKNAEGGVADVLDLSEKKVERKAANKQVDSVECFDMDKEQYKDLVDDSPNIQANIDVGEIDYKGFPDLSKDLYMSLYKYQPLVRAEDSMKDGYRFNNEMVRNMIESENYEKLRKFTSLNDVSSLIGTEVLSQEVLQIIKQYKRDNQERMQDINDMIKNQKGMEDANGQLQALQGLADMNGGQLPPDLQNMQNDLQNQKKSMEQSIQDLKPKVDTPTPSEDLKNAMNQAVNKAAGEAEEANDIMETWLSGSDPGEIQRIPYQQKKDFIEKIRNSRELKKLQELVGRFKDTARMEQKRKTKEYGHTIEDVKTGNKVEKLLASETMKLKNDVTKAEFYKRYNEKSLLEYETLNNIQKKQGPIVVAVDTSGSMSGQREHWSKAVAIALLEIAGLQKRNFAVVFFDTRPYKIIEIEKGKATPQEILDVAETHTGGGTSFQPALEACLNVMSKSKFDKADLVFITDGEDHIDVDFASKMKVKKKEKDFKIVSIIISDRKTEALARISDETHYIYDLANNSEDVDKLNHHLFSSI